MIQYTMTSFNKFLIPITIVILIFMGYLVYLLNSTQHHNQTLNRLETIYTLTQNLLEQQMQHALSLSILLANDSELKQSYMQNDREGLYEILSQKLAMQNLNYEVQIHDKHLRTYLRSWDNTIVGEDLAIFRQGLVQVSQSQEPQVSIELGKRLNIKAISPIFDKQNYIGSVEVIVGFEELQQMLYAQNAHLYILLEQKHLDIATATSENPRVSNFVVANFNSNEKYLNHLENSNLSALDIYGFIIQESFALSYFTIYDSSAQSLGYIITIIEV